MKGRPLLLKGNNILDTSKQEFYKATGEGIEQGITCKSISSSCACVPFVQLVGNLIFRKRVQCLWSILQNFGILGLVVFMTFIFTPSA